jgi:outer membrane protein TolC
MKTTNWGILALAALPLIAQEPLTLQDAVRMALQQHPSIEASAARADAAGTRIKQAQSNYLPKLNWQETIDGSNNPIYVFGSKLTQRNFTMSDFAIDKLNTPGFYNNFQSQLSLEQTIYDAGQTKNQKKSAEFGKSIADEQVRSTEQQAIANVVRTYYGAALASEALKVAEEALKSAQADLKRAEDVRSAGMATDADVLSIKVHLAAVEEQKIARGYDLEVAQSAVNEALGLPLDTRHELTTPLTALSVADRQAANYEGQASSERPELRQADLAAQMAEAQSKAARSGYWPRVFARAVFEADRKKFVTDGGGNWYFGATMQWNLFNGNQTRERVREATHMLRSAEAEKRRADAGIRLQVRKARADLMAAQERIAVASAAVTQAEESLRITKNRYEGGLANVTDLLRNETALMESRTRRLAAVYDQRVAAAMLELATGVLSEDSDVLK